MPFFRIPVQSGIFQALGLCLILEGVMSAVGSTLYVFSSDLKQTALPRLSQPVDFAVRHNLHVREETAVPQKIC